MTGGEAVAAPKRLRTYEELLAAGMRRAQQLPPRSPQALERVARIMAPALLANSRTAEGDPHPP